MTRLDALRASGLIDGKSIDDDIDTFNETFGCPTGVGCRDGIPCQECWRKWLNEETNLEAKLQ